MTIEDAVRLWSGTGIPSYLLHYVLYMYLVGLYALGCIGCQSHPVIRRQVALRAGSIFFAWADLSHMGQAYSAVE